MLTTLKSKITFSLIVEILVLLILFYLSFVVNQSNRKELWEFDDSDIKYEYAQALEIGSGQNPYEKILSGNLLSNNKYATLLPLYYYLLYFFAYLGNFSLEGFLDVYRTVLYFSNYAAGLFIYLMFRRENNKALGILALTFFLFNRWTTLSIRSVKQDVLAVSFLIASLYFLKSHLRSHKTLSYLLYGVSVGIKHLGGFVFPVYLLPLLYGKMSLKDFGRNMFMFLIPTFFISLPIIVDNPQALFYSLLFSFTRQSNQINGAFGFEKLLVLYNVGVEKNNIIYYLIPRTPLFFVTGLSVILLLIRKIPVYVYSMGIFFIFLAFNPVLFQQYFMWIVPLVYLSALRPFDFEKKVS